MTKEFIEQTANDYDMSVHEVERIAKLFPNDFYNKLEDYISERQKTNQDLDSLGYRYDVFYEIHGETAKRTVRGKNKDDAKRVFKNIYGGWKITNVQRLK